MRSRAALLVTLVVALGACGDDDVTTDQPANVDSPSSAPAGTSPSRSMATTPTSSPTRTTTRGTVVTTADSEFGEILFDGEGQAIYLFEKEQSNEAECYDACADEWPPVLTNGDPVADAMVASDRLGTTARTDGSTQVTYAGHPLYYYAHEGENEVKCHNISEFGGLWLVVTPGGNAAPA
jgi:predicted lipoprotein with Yx(FWY)xxD motif